MATAIKVDDATKALLDRLQAKLTLELGRKPTLQEIVDGLAKMGWRERELLARELGSAWRPLTPKEIRQVESGIADWGVETREEDIDKALYGGEDAA